jgi:quinol-cytochrome oxidoreductase complex cytochrome b subunit
MPTDPNFWQREPAIIVGVVTAALTLATAFGLGLTADQQTAILGFVGAGLALIGSLVVRSQVTPTATIQK